jgi:hypothetical protein
LKFLFAPGSLKLSTVLQIRPWFALNTLQRVRGLQFAPWPWEAVAPAQFRRADRAPGRANGSGRVRAHLGEGWRSWLRRRSCQRGVRRRPAAAAATARGSGEKKRMDDNVRPGEVLRVLGERVGRSAGGGSERCCKFTSGGGNGGRRLGWRAEGENGGI